MKSIDDDGVSNRAYLAESLAGRTSSKENYF